MKPVPSLDDPLVAAAATRIAKDPYAPDITDATVVTMRFAPRPDGGPAPD